MGFTSTEPAEHMQTIDSCVWCRMVTLLPNARVPLAWQGHFREAGSY